MWILIIIVVIVLIFVVSKKKSQNSNIIAKTEKMEKNHYFEKHYEQNKNSSISELNESIEQNRKDSYDEYSVEDKMKFKAQKSLIEEKMKYEWSQKIENLIQNTNINIDLLSDTQKDYQPINEIDTIVRSLCFVNLTSDKTKSESVDFYSIKDKEITSVVEALVLYAEIIQNENSALLTYINAIKRISIIIGKEKLYLTDYYFLANVWKVLAELQLNGNKITYDIQDIAERLLKAEKKLRK